MENGPYRMMVALVPFFPRILFSLSFFKCNFYIIKIQKTITKPSYTHSIQIKHNSGYLSAHFGFRGDCTLQKQTFMHRTSSQIIVNGFIVTSIDTYKESLFYMHSKVQLKKNEKKKMRAIPILSSTPAQEQT